MAASVQVTFRDIPHSDAVAAHVEKRAAKLETFFHRIVKTHVVVEAPHRHHKHGQRYHVRIDMQVPGKELVVSRNLDDSREDMHAAVDDAFADAERVLESYASKIRHSETRSRSRPPTAIVTRVFAERGYGFLEDGDGREIYFHANSVRGGKFDKLASGTRVRYAEEDGDKGPQASTVEVLAKQG
jgi:ribosomal subunit interface protein